MRPVTVTVSAEAASDPIPVNWRERNFKIGFGVVVDGTLTYTMQHTFDNVLDGETPTWFDHEFVAAETESQDGNYAFPITAVRLNVTAHTSGTATLKLLQAT